MAELYDQPFVGNPNLLRQGAKARKLAQARDVNTLPDPRTYAMVQGLLGTAPDEMGFSAMHPDLPGIKAVAEPAFAVGTALNFMPATKGLPVGGSIKPVGTGLGYSKEAMALRYPETIPGVLAVDKKTGKQFLQKQLSPEALAVQKVRKAAQAEIDRGDYTPMFDITKREYVDPANYPLKGNTLVDTLPKKQETPKSKTVLQPDTSAIFLIGLKVAAGSVETPIILHSVGPKSSRRAEAASPIRPISQFWLNLPSKGQPLRRGQIGKDCIGIVMKTLAN